MVFSPTIPMTSFDKTPEQIIAQMEKKGLLDALQSMLLIRNFETRAEGAYLQGKIGGFFHSYIGQEAIQTAAVMACGVSNWYITSYRCHALALLLKASPRELMAELYGKATGNALGRGGSMHFFTERLLGGYGIVGGQVPIATGAALSLKYRGIKDELAICFLGDGAVAQGAFHESLNMAGLWNLPCIYVIENNQWSMGTAVERGISVKEIAQKKAPGYGIEGYSVDGMDFFSCYACFEHLHKMVLETQRPVLLEVITERFKGHSISDPGLYRSKENLKTCMQRDPLLLLKNVLIQEGMLQEEEYKQIDKQYRDLILEAMDFAEESPWPHPATLEDDVFAP